MFDASEFVWNAVKEIQNIIGRSRVISACSGGVDSTVATVLAHKAVGENLVAVFIDDGLRREGEPEFVMRTLKSLGIRARLIDAKQEFFDTFKGKTDAEEKRKADNGKSSAKKEE